MLQQALFMQHMQGSMRGFAVGQQFFTHSRHSMVRAPPRLGFPGMSFQPQQRMFYKDYQRGYERKRELEPGTTSQATGSEVKPLGVPKAASEAEQDAISPAEPENREEPESEDGPEPSAKRLKSLEEEGCSAESSVGVSQEDTETDSPDTGLDNLQQGKVDCIPNAQNISLDSKTEAPSTGSSLKVTIQQSSESRAISATAQKPVQRSSEGNSTVQPTPGMGPKFFCYICKASYQSPEQFQSHMATAQHLQRLQEIQHMSNTCLVTFMPVAKESPVSVTGRAGRAKPQQQRWCNACQVHFNGDLILHRRTPEHKLAKHSLRPFCTVCSRHFKTPRKFVEHMKSPDHKQKAHEERVLEKEPGGPEDAEELITVDAVGCFEDDEDEEDGTDEEENADVLTEAEDCTPRQDGAKEKSFQDCEENEEYCPDVVYGLDFVVPVAGYLCRLCHKFYPSDSAARIAHCKSLMHFQNVKKLRAKSRAQHESGLCPEEPGATLEGDQSQEHASQGPGEEEPWPPGSCSPIREDDEDMGGARVTAEEEHGGEAREEGVETHETGDGTQEEGDAPATSEDMSPSVCRRSCRRKNRSEK